MFKKILLFTLLVGCFFSTNVSAKWWIFGQSDENVATRYLYLNDISFSELDEKVTLYNDMLPGGRVILRGKAQAGKNKIGKVEVSLDKKETWQKAQKSNDGSFEFSFVPEINRIYPLYVKILDTTGKSNEVDETYREITVSNANINSVVRQALDAMITAYQNEEPRTFMEYVDPNFAGDDMVLDRAIRKDFSAFDGLNVTYTLNNVVSGTKGKVYAVISYNRRVSSARSGETLTDRGLTEFIFTLNAGKAKVSAMKNPLIFGLSEASEVGTGTVNSGENAEVLVVDDSGTVSTKTLDEILNGSAASDIISNSFNVVIGINLAQGYPFVYSFLTPNELNFPAGSYSKSLGTTDIDTVTSVTEPTGHDFFMISPNASGNSIAVKFADGKYMLLQHTAGHQLGSTIKYRFQPDGTTTF